MEARAQWRFARISAQRARFMANELRGKSLEQAYEVIQVVPRKSAQYWKKLVESAVANLKVAKENDVDPARIYIKDIYADKGPVWKRWIPRAMGRATPIAKPTAHLTVVVAEL